MGKCVHYRNPETRVSYIACVLSLKVDILDGEEKRKVKIRYDLTVPVPGVKKQEVEF